MGQHTAGYSLSPLKPAHQKLGVAFVARDVDGKNFVSGGGGGLLLVSRDAGVTWKRVSATQATLYSGAFGDAGNIVIAGEDGLLLRSGDVGVSWTEVRLDPGTRVHKVVHTAGRFFVAVSGADFRGILVSSDGLKWSKENTPPPFRQWTDIAAGPAGTVLAVSFGRAILRRTNGEWRHVQLGTEESNFPSGASLTSILAALADGSFLTSSRNQGLVHVTADGEARAVDGRSYNIATQTADASIWAFSPQRTTRFTFPLNAGEHLTSSVGAAATSLVLRDGRLLVGTQNGAVLTVAADEVRQLAVPHTEPVEQLLQGAGEVLVARMGDGLLTASGAGTWSTVVPPGNSKTLAASCATSTGMILIRAEDALFRSTQPQPVKLEGKPTGSKIEDLQCGSNEAAHVLLANGDVLSTESAGQTWTTSNAASEHEVQRMRLVDESTVFLLGRSIYLRRGSEPWAKVYSPPAGADGNIIQGVVRPKTKAYLAFDSSGGLLRSGTSEQGTWVAVPGRRPAFSKISVLEDGALVAISKEGIYRSTDEGQSWSQASTDTSELTDLVVVSPGQVLVAVGKEGAILRSPDAGGTWKQVLSGTNADFIRLSVNGHGRITALTLGGAVYGSMDGGLTWEVLGAPKAVDWPRRSVGRPVMRAHDFVETAHSGIVVVGAAGALFQLEAVAPAPSLTSVVPAYSLGPAQHPQLSVQYKDPNRLCEEGKCLKFEARSKAFEESNHEPLPLPASAIESRGDGRVVATLDPDLVSARTGEPIYVRVTVRAPGYAHAFPHPRKFFAVPNHPDRTLLYAGTGLLGLMIVLFGVARVRPLWILALASKPAALDKATDLFSGVAKAGLGAVQALYVPLIARQDSVLGAWVATHKGVLLQEFQKAASQAAGRYPPYSPLPVEGPDGSRILPSPQDFGPLLKGKRNLLQILGQGGAGKTRLAIEIGKWYFESKELAGMCGAVVFIDEEFGDLRQVVIGKLKAAVPERLPSDDILEALFGRGWICVIVDRISERTAATRKAFESAYQQFAPRTLICTARVPIDVDGAVATVLKPLPLDSATLLSFLGDQIRLFGASNVYKTIAAQGQLVQQLASQITLEGRELPLTPLLVRIFVLQAIEAASSNSAGEVPLPKNIPQAYFAYVDGLDVANRDSPARPEDVLEMRKAARLIAYVELGWDFRPKPVDVSEVLAEFERAAVVNGQKLINRFEGNGLLVQKTDVTTHTIEFILDPLAECLAALEHVRRCGADPVKWAALEERVRARGAAARGFVLALRMNYLAFRQPLKLCDVDFASFTEAVEHEAA